MKKRPVLFTFNHQPCAKAQSIIFDVRWYGPSPIPTLVEEIRRKALAKCRIGLVTLRGIPYGHVTELKRLLPEADLVEFGPSFNRIRRVRSEEELIYFRRSGFLTDLACIALERRLHPGMNEQEILGVIYDAYLKHSGGPRHTLHSQHSYGRARPVCPLAARNRKKVLETGSVVITELTVSYWGYSTQIHRPFAVGREPSPLYRKLLMSL
jgi:Xaa-Pro aminopeptidase